MKRLKRLLTVALLLATGSLMAQSLGEFKPKEGSYGLKNLKGANRIYIATFNVHYQIYNEKSDFKKGSYMLGGGYRSSASTQASVGLDGLTEQDVQKITNKLYADYTGLLKAKGMTLASPEDAAKTSVYEDYIKLSGGKVSLAQIPGTMTSTPTGYEHFAKKNQ